MILIFGSSKISAQKVYYTKFKNDADLVIYITKDKSKADLIVKKVSHNDEVKPGFWKEAKLEADAELIVFISKQNTTDIKKVYFTKFGDEVKF
ncbi:hypothetical protein K0U91_06725 [Chryseobacterium chendengshani]|uniref:DUF6150 family protein n=1 Tax=Chryseobacterium sp. LJ668 TaxID=2864040 RepID=UPI001C68C633|nr:DUF6150 family protein [Chryseobacterium sp. LJ668]MBW8522160.1 hypothetical protein [Chryseobacterium sp. LJ668]QYK17806.1 hypothetical protein K0U91_06725 [Chryseobacterium sp. LJ668]